MQSNQQINKEIDDNLDILDAQAKRLNYGAGQMNSELKSQNQQADQINHDIESADANVVKATEDAHHLSEVVTHGKISWVIIILEIIVIIVVCVIPGKKKNK